VYAYPIIQKRTTQLTLAVNSGTLQRHRRRPDSIVVSRLSVASLLIGFMFLRVGTTVVYRTTKSLCRAFSWSQAHQFMDKALIPVATPRAGPSPWLSDCQQATAPGCLCR